MMPFATTLLVPPAASMSSSCPWGRADRSTGTPLCRALAVRGAVAPAVPVHGRHQATSRGGKRAAPVPADAVAALIGHVSALLAHTPAYPTWRPAPTHPVR